MWQKTSAFTAPTGPSNAAAASAKPVSQPRNLRCLSPAGWYGDYVDPTTLASDLLRSTDGNNDGKYANPAYDAPSSDKAAAEADPQRRLKILSDAEAMVVHDEFPFIPLYQYADGLIFDPDKIEGVSLNDRFITPLKWIHRKSGADAPVGR